jgi:hypothetical protein
MGLEYLGWCCVFVVVVEFQLKPMCKLLWTIAMSDNLACGKEVLSTPDGFLTSNYTRDECDESDDEQHWDDSKRLKEANAIEHLLLFCRDNILGAIEPGVHVLSEASLLQNVGNAILPFGRTLILLLWASSTPL